jgi:hypothetical protein
MNERCNERIEREERGGERKLGREGEIGTLLGSEEG